MVKTEPLTALSHPAFFLGGTSKSGKTPLRFILNRHWELTSFAGTNLLTYQEFRHFPEWIYKSPRGSRGEILDIFKRLCLTRFYCFRERSKGKYLRDLWWKADRFWLSRFEEPQKRFWRTPAGRFIERVWLSESVQRRSFGWGRAPRRETGFCGLGFPDQSGPGLSRNDIERHLGILDPMNFADSLDEVYRIYGEFWHGVFSEFARIAGKRYWIKEATYNVASSRLWRRCFDKPRLIHVVRDGRDVAFDRVAKYGGSYELALRAWVVRMQKNLRAQQKFLPGESLIVRYEDLVRDTRKTLQRVTDFMEVDFDPAMLDRPLKPDFIGRFRNSWSEKMKANAIDGCGKLLRQLGYDY